MAIAEDNFPFFSVMFATNICMQKLKLYSVNDVVDIEYT